MTLQQRHPTAVLLDLDGAIIVDRARAITHPTPARYAEDVAAAFPELGESVYQDLRLDAPHGPVALALPQVRQSLRPDVTLPRKTVDRLKPHPRRVVPRRRGGRR